MKYLYKKKHNWFIRFKKMEERKKEKQIYFFIEHWQIDKKFNSLDTRKKRLEPKTINEKKTFF